MEGRQPGAMALIAERDFVHLLAVEFDLDETVLHSDTRLGDYLELDSLEILRLAVFLDLVIPIGMRGDPSLESLTVADLYAIYCSEFAEQMLRKP
jgi:hypothetical protein